MVTVSVYSTHNRYCLEGRFSLRYWHCRSYSTQQVLQQLNYFKTLNFCCLSPPNSQVIDRVAFVIFFLIILGFLATYLGQAAYNLSQVLEYNLSQVLEVWALTEYSPPEIVPLSLKFKNYLN